MASRALPPTRDLSPDRAFCRAMLPRVSRTFAINIRLLRGSLSEAVRIGYLLCRAADTLEDAWPGSAGEIGARFDRLIAALAGDRTPAAELSGAAAGVDGGRAEFELLAELPRVLRVHAALPPADREAVTSCLRTLATGMRRYATRAAGRSAASPYLDDERELHDYCFVVAGCVGIMLTRLFATRVPARDPATEERRLALAPAVGEALQLTNILLDWPADVRRGRCFVPGAWLEERGAGPITSIWCRRAACATACSVCGPRCGPRPRWATRDAIPSSRGGRAARACPAASCGVRRSARCWWPTTRVPRGAWCWRAREPMSRLT